MGGFFSSLGSEVKGSVPSLGSGSGSGSGGSGSVPSLGSGGSGSGGSGGNPKIEKEGNKSPYITENNNTTTSTFEGSVTTKITENQKKLDQNSKMTSEDIGMTSGSTLQNSFKEHIFIGRKFNNIEIEKLTTEEKVIYKKLDTFFDKHSIDKSDIPFEYMLQFSSKNRIEKGIFSHLSEEEPITFKIILSSLEPVPFLFKPIVNLFSQKAKYGRTHTALQVGRSIVEWFDSSLVHIKEFKKSSAAFAYDLCITKEEKLKNTIQNREMIVNTIYKWNTQKIYSLMNENCQGFVEDLFKEIKYEPNYPNIVKEYFNGILESDQNAKPNYFENGKRIFFKNHLEFDEWVKKEILPKYSYDSDEFFYYKSFDRSFWINGDLVENCCFGNPTGI